MGNQIDKTALITGASRGLGLALARVLAESGWNLVIDARFAEVLEFVQDELAQLTEVIAIPGDVADAEHRQELEQYRVVTSLFLLKAIVLSPYMTCLRYFFAT